ncbi:hypothetical protein DQO83_06400 [Salmonella enterica]|nr:hypothetical protein [Salmonella enterica]
MPRQKTNPKRSCSDRDYKKLLISRVNRASNRSKKNISDNLEPIPVGVIVAGSLDTDSAEEPERTRST